MVGVEIDFIVSDSIKALELYKKIFAIEEVEVTNFRKGLNEVVFNLYNTRFHMLDENLDYGLVGPSKDKPNTIWFNVLVEDISDTFNKAVENGCSVFQPITEISDFKMKNAIIIDPFGYMWMLHEIKSVISFKERVKKFEEKINNE